jgi:hypothetical protein
MDNWTDDLDASNSRVNSKSQTVGWNGVLKLQSKGFTQQRVLSFEFTRGGRTRHARRQMHSRAFH